MEVPKYACDRHKNAQSPSPFFSPDPLSIKHNMSGKMDLKISSTTSSLAGTGHGALFWGNGSIG